MTAYAFDGASMFDLALAKAKGGILATVYIVGHPGGMQPADRARVNAIRAIGLGASPNWERAANFFDTCSVAEARAAGVEATAACHDLGFPEGGKVSCSFSFDFDTSGPRLREMGQKLQAVNAGMGGHYLPMCYGEQELIDYLATNKIIPGKSWLMMSTFGQPYYPRSPHVCMVQGHDLDGLWIQSKAVPGSDINTVTDPQAVHAWWPPNSPYGGADMPLTQADADLIWGSNIDKRSAAYRLEAANQALSDQAKALADLKAAVITLAAAVAKVQPGGGGAPAPNYTGTVTLTPKP